MQKVGQQMNRERIEETVRLWQAEPDKAKGKPMVIARAEGEGSDGARHVFLAHRPVEKGGVTFEAVHVQGAETVAREAVAAGVARLVLVSGIGADPDLRSPLHPCSRSR